MQKFISDTTQDIRLAELITQECERTCTNLCSTFDDWTKCAMALATLGEDARSLFHRLAALDTQYKHRETNIKFTNCLRTANRITMATLVYLAGNAGIDVKRLREQLKADGSYSVPVASTPQKPRISAPKPQRVDFIHPNHIAHAESEKRGLKTNLGVYLANLYGQEAVESAFEAYHIGSIEVLKSHHYNGKIVFEGKETRTLFPQIDINGKCRTGKVIRYLTNGHRNKAVNPSWLHTELKKWQEYQTQVTGKCPDWITKDFSLSQCLFGEHLLTENPAATVCLVEAEKTAVIMHSLFPQKRYNWLAVGSKSNFTWEKLQVLKGCNVKVFADVDAGKEWKSKVEQWAKQGLTAGINIQFVDWQRKFRLPEDCKADIADIYLANREAEIMQQRKPYEIPDLVKMMFPDNPCGLYQLCEVLQLEIVNEDEFRKAHGIPAITQESATAAPQAAGA